MVSLSMRDENFSGRVMHEVPVSFRSAEVTMKDIIEARVRSEVEEYNNKKPDYFRGLVEPAEAEKTINGLRLRAKKTIDAEKQVYVALDAFQKNGFFVLVNNEQCSSLDQQFSLQADTRISFIKLTPLVGG
jgi:hypothetical protein